MFINLERYNIMIQSCISIENVTKSFGQKTVLSGINLNISKGEIFGLLGPSGAGKTTLMKIITAQLKVSSGRVTINNVDTVNFDRKMYSSFGMVLDNLGLYKRMSCYDNLKIFSEIYNIKKSAIDEILKNVGLYEARKTPADKLSKGMKQRLVFARALLHNPPILFLDEPTTGLDPSTCNVIHNMIKNEQKKGKTILLTTHNMVEATKLCDNVALLNEGNIVEYGAPDEICRKHNMQNEISILTKDGKQITFPNSPSNSEKIAQFFKEDNVASIHSTEPTLETVFLKLTGRKFENDEP